MTFHGFDPARLTTFAGDLDTLAGRAGGLHGQLSAVLNSAQANLPPGQRASNHADLQQLVTVSGSATTTNPLAPSLPGPVGATTMLPGLLTGELGTMQAEIKRRVAQLNGVVAFQAAGYPVDDASVFLDEAAPDGAKVDTALQTLLNLQRTDFGDDGDNDELTHVGTVLTGLTAAELDAVISRADPATLARYSELLDDHRSAPWLGFQDNGVPAEDRDAVLDTLLSRIGPENFAKFTAAFPSVQPIYTNTMAYKDGENPQNKADGRGVHYENPALPLFNGPVSVGQIHQVGIGDCWYFAALDSLAQRNPQFLQQGIKQNPNGTVSVRIWDKSGNYHWVTVTPDLLVNGDHSTVSATGDNCTWPAYYEKAFAVAYGGKDGYGGIEGGFSDKAAPYVSGSSGHDIKSGGVFGLGKHDNMDIANMKRLYDSGKGVTVGTLDVDDHAPGAPDGFVGGHAYSVSGFTDDGKVILSNPWDPAHLKVTVSQAQLNMYFEDPEWFDIP
ncbi:MAG: peptidase C2 calpain [Streptomyces sp.]|nr:peptidase C2 calpain [Streptomyces sp.]